MTTIYMGMAGLLLLAVALVIVPLLGSRRQQAQQRADSREMNIQLAKERKAELQQEREDGLLSEQDYQQALNELTLSLASDIQPQASHKGRVSGIIAWGIAAAICVLSLGIYSQVSELDKIADWQDANQQLSALAKRLVIDGDDNATEQDYQRLILALRTRLNEQPDDPTGWMLIGSLYGSLGYAEPAVAALHKALELTPDDSSIRLRLVQALMASEDEAKLKEADFHLQQLRGTEPDNTDVIALSAMLAEQNGQQALAMEHWQRLLPLLPEDSDAYRGLQKKLQRMQQGNTLIAVNVTIAPELAERLPRQASLFVFAKDAAGLNPMPAAVVRMPLPDLPVTVVLSDEQAMTSEYSLSDLTDVVVTARVSLDQSAETRSGELQGQAQISIRVGEKNELAVIIDQEVTN